MQDPEFKFVLDAGLDESFLPQKATPYDTGWDVKAAETVIFKPLDMVKVPLGFRAFCPPGYWLELRPRSSTFMKKRLSALYGVIDECYEGPVCAALLWIPNWDMAVNDPMGPTLVVEKGERICQLVPFKRQEMGVVGVSEEEYKQLCSTRGAKRGEGGFGSTGDK